MYIASQKQFYLKRATGHTRTVLLLEKKSINPDFWSEEYLFSIHSDLSSLGSFEERKKEMNP